MRFVSFTGALLLCAACGDPAAMPTVQPAPPGPRHLEYDYGVIPHREARAHDFVLDLAALGPVTPGSGWIPLHVQLDCSCGRAQLLLRGRDGSERVLDGRPVAANVPAPGDTVIARVVIDTATREAMDLPKTASHGTVVLQPVDDRTGARRVRWPLLLRFGIDAPVDLRPFAALDFGRVPTCSTAEVATSLRGDANHPGVTFGRVVASDPQLEAVLEPGDGSTLLRVRCHPGELGNHRAVVTVETDLPGDYVVQVPVTWKVVPDLEATPMAKVSFRADLRREQTVDEASGQFVLVTDHDASRPAEFVVRALVDAADHDATAGFAITFEPVPGQPRQQRLHVRYLGGHPDGFRGRIVLGKPGVDGPTLSIDLVAFPTRDS
ncbi:MAG: hypothetical protein JNM25_09750 [Planctomycetes bacterium]|nr:hypothetical protein [Planctomycetota bacterium]